MDTLVELVRALAWPMVALCAIWTFRSPISGFVGRATRADFGPKGISLRAEAAAAGRLQRDAKIESPTGQQELPASTAQSPQLPPSGTIYDALDADLQGRLQQNFGDDKDTKLAWAVRMYDMTAIELAHERNYRLFFTSQIFAVRRLNELIRVPVSRGRELYDEAARQNPEAYKNLPFESWIAFLKYTRYVAVEGEVDEAIASITPLGKDFLAWMIGRSVPETKSF
jgi:hypothetical protein